MEFRRQTAILYMLYQYGRENGEMGFKTFYLTAAQITKTFFLLFGEERVFLSETLQAQQAKLFCAHQMIRVEQVTLVSPVQLNIFLKL